MEKTRWTKIYNELFWMGAGREQYEQVKGPVAEKNRRSVVSWSICVGILIGHVVAKARFERFVYAESAMKLAEIQKKYACFDQLTGLKNRRAYFESLPDCCCLFFR